MTIKYGLSKKKKLNTENTDEQNFKSMRKCVITATIQLRIPGRKSWDEIKHIIHI